MNTATLTKGQTVTFEIRVMADWPARIVTGEYVGPIKPSAKYPEGGHKVRVLGQITHLSQTPKAI